MFAKIFNQIFDSSIVDEPQTRFTFMDFLILADKNGVVDMTHEAIARRTNRPLPIIRRTITELEGPDPRSRSPEANGARIFRLDDHRDWGWGIVNYDYYRKIATQEQRRERTKLRTRKWRERRSKASQASPNVTVTFSDDLPSASAYSSSYSFGKTENLFFGSVPEDLIELAPRLMPTEKADQWQDYVEAQIKLLGYKVWREVPCELPGEEHGGGRIDLVAYKDNLKIAIELDYRTPRQKSIRKVKLYEAGMVLLRDPKIVEKRKGKPRDQSEVEDYCASISLPRSDGEAMFLHWQEKGWAKIKDWKLTIQKWKSFGYLPSQKKRPASTTLPLPLVPTWGDRKAQKEMINEVQEQKNEMFKMKQREQRPFTPAEQAKYDDLAKRLERLK